MDATLSGVAVSVVTRAELFAGRDEPARLERLLAAMFELPVEREIADLAGRTRRVAGIPLADALIAATALVHGIPVMTRNRRHFERVAGLRLAEPA